MCRSINKGVSLQIGCSLISNFLFSIHGNTMASNVPIIKLNSGYDFPAIGYGTFGGPHAPEQVYHGTKHALEAGYRHIDTAYVYETEEAVGKAVRESGIDRKDIFITTKLFQTFHEPKHVRPAFDISLKLLGVEYVDLYLMHWPFAWEFHGYSFDDIKGHKDENGHRKRIDVSIVDTYRAMEELVKAGVVKSIGVSNFTIPMLEQILKECDIPPAVNQVEIHPSLPQEELLAWCKEHNIVLTAYSPLGNPGHRGQPAMMDHPAVLSAAKKYNVSPVQVLLNWGVSRGYTVIPKSVTPERIKANLARIEMDKDDIEAIASIGREHPHRICDPIKIFGPAFNIFD
ncbi:NADP-dependent oxidoreductase domain-containing protein [Zychaea mexicana]|uniref:NADP-dependent oxidoreductase domain-containing protein n=1 Tax=Zychaea mexicana TaxID=64656 RepID=UPI0022FE49AF|nr:NADP-dependent oxidoreductase domain-containing protein [Zychaea mexicana]KAI9488666.1 NADP-dependent oxidoreductase domain-containing protein [Zychaea mexicana]